MLDEFVVSGQWWLPNCPDILIFGKLSFSPRNGAKLELYGSFYKSPFEEISHLEENENSATQVNSNPSVGVPLRLIQPEEKIILGLLDNNEEITLYGCRYSSQTLKFGVGRNGSCFSFNIQYIFRQIHFWKEEEIKLKSISIQYSNLEKWISVSGIQNSFDDQGNQISVIYKKPSSIHLLKFNDLDLEITFSSKGSYFDIPYFKSHIEQKTFLTIQNICDQSLEECFNLVINFRDLLSFAMTIPTSVISITGKVDITHTKFVEKEPEVFKREVEIQETQVIIIFNLSNPEKISNVNLAISEMLFLFSDIEDFGNVFEAWLNKRELYESVFDLLLITMYSPDLYLHYKFLNIIQALEAYHTMKYEVGIYQDQKVYKKGLYKKFLDVLEKFPSEHDDKENGISDEFKKALKGKLKLQTRFTLETRLKEILIDILPLLPNNFIGKDTAIFANKASETRNALTHHDKEKRKKAAQGKELFQLFHSLSVVLQICLLREINIPDESIRDLIVQNRKYQREWHPPSNGT